MCIYSNFSPKIACHGNALCPLYTGVSQMNSLIVPPYPKIKLCMDMLHKTEVMAIFVIFLPIYFGQNLVAMATSLRPLQSEIFFGLVYNENPLL